MDKIVKAIEALKNGKFVLIFDDENREGETDLVMAAKFVVTESIEIMRKDGGGLICIAMSDEVAKKLEIPYMVDVLRFSSSKFRVLSYLSPTDIPYDERSSFSLTINSRDTFTGITDKDRALTIKKFADLAESAINGHADAKRFGELFRSPGHVHLLIAAKGLLAERRGHTELSVALLKHAGIVPVSVVCEMLWHDKALPKEKAKLYAERNGYVFLEGSEIVEGLK
mgnify:CR=1 FL=1